MVLFVGYFWNHYHHRFPQYFIILPTIMYTMKLWIQVMQADKIKLKHDSIKSFNIIQSTHRPNAISTFLGLFKSLQKKNAKVQLQDSKQKWRQASLAPAWGGQYPNGLPAELFFTGLMDISDGHRADNPEDSCASVKRSQIAPYGAVWPFHLCLLRRDVRVCGGGASSCFLLKI